MTVERKWYVYILRCGDGTLYTGITDDVARRLEKHRAGEGAKYTRAGARWRFAIRKNSPPIPPLPAGNMKSSS